MDAGHQLEVEYIGRILGLGDPPLLALDMVVNEPP